MPRKDYCHLEGTLSMVDLKGSKVSVAVSVAIVLPMQVRVWDGVHVVNIHATGLSGGQTIPSQPRSVRRIP